MEEIYYSPGDVIYSNSDVGDSENALIYIYKGKVQCWTYKNKIGKKPKSQIVSHIYLSYKISLTILSKIRLFNDLHKAFFF